MTLVAVIGPQAGLEEHIALAWRTKGVHTRKGEQGPSHEGVFRALLLGWIDNEGRSQR